MEIVNNAVQTVAANNNILFTETAVNGSKCIIHREGSGLVTLRGLTSGCQTSARFFIDFGANVAIPTVPPVGAISLALAISGEPVATSQMIVTPAAVEEYFNVSSALNVTVPSGCCLTIAVENTSGQPIEVQNANLIVTRVA